MPIDLNDLVATKGPALTWTVMFAVYLVSSILLYSVTWFPNALIYSLAFLLVAITLAKAWKHQKIGSLFGIMVFFVAMLTWVCSAGYIPASAGMWLALVFTILAFMNEYGWIAAKAKDVGYKYILVGAFGSILLFGFLYFMHRLGLIPVNWPPVWGWGPLPWFTVINHLGILLMALLDMLIILGVGDWEKWRIYRYATFALALIGALAILNAGWGLGILG